MRETWKQQRGNAVPPDKKMAATLLSYTSSKDQLKWHGKKESLLTWLQVESSDIPASQRQRNVFGNES